MSETGSIMSPYQVAPSQGNLLGGIMDFIGKKRQLEQEQQMQQTMMATQQALNSQQGYADGVDPFSMQKFATGESNLQTAETNRGVSQGRFDLDKQTQDSSYGAAAAIAKGLQPGGASHGMYDRPDINMLLPGASNPAVLDQIIKQIGGIETNQQNGRNFETERSATNLDNLQEIEARAQAEGRVRSNDNTQQRQIAVEAENRGVQRNQDATRGLLAGFGRTNTQGMENIPYNAIPDVMTAIDGRNAQTNQMIVETIKAVAQSKDKMDPQAIAGIGKVLEGIQTGEVDAKAGSELVRQILGRKQEEQKMIEEQKKSRDPKGLGKPLGELFNQGFRLPLGY